MHAAAVAGLHDLILALPMGYETPVGQRGLLLSGGQKQRISIARAVLKDAPILILDEATSAVDNETELAIQTALTHITKGKTTLIIAHRLSTIRQADTIHVIEQGAIVESGTHAQLLASQGKYAQLWMIQTGAANEL